MSNIRLYLPVAALIGASLLGSRTAGTSGGYLETNLSANARTETDSNPVVLITDLAADVPNLIDTNGILHGAAVVDPNLVNPWGIAESSGSPFWVSDNNQGVSTLYRVPGANNTPVSINPLVVSIPSPLDPLGADGTPTGAVFNLDLAGQGFKISGVDKNNNAATAAAIFLFATEDGTIVGWNPGINPAGFDPNKAGTDGAVYKGLAMAKDAVSGNTFLYATNFRAGTVQVYDTAFKLVTPSANAFTDPKLPSGYAPFNIVPAGGVLYVTYAVQDAAKHDDVAGHAHGVVDSLAQAPASFGPFAGAILIGNFGNGRINAFDPGTGEFLGTVVNSKGQEILIDGLWSLRVGNGGAGGDTNTIYFTAGPNGEKDGLFGSLTPVALGTPCGTPCI